MKIALAFYGQLRNIDICYPYWKTNVIDPLGIKDVYVHTYHEPEDTVKWNSIHSSSFKAGPSVLQEFKELYKPKVLIESEYEDVKKSEQYFEPDPNRFAYCLYQSFTPQTIFFSMYNVMNLINDEEYDAVLLSRTDNIFVKALKELPIKENEILTTSFATNYDANWVSDMVVAGTPIDIKKYAAIYTNYRKFYDEGESFHVEYMMGLNVRRQGLNQNVFFKYPTQHHMIRDQKELMNL